jgi:hypothetical protein
MNPHTKGKYGFLCTLFAHRTSLTSRRMRHND